MLTHVLIHVLRSHLWLYLAPVCNVDVNHIYFFPGVWVQAMNLIGKQHRFSHPHHDKRLHTDRISHFIKWEPIYWKIFQRFWEQKSVFGESENDTFWHWEQRWQCNARYNENIMQNTKKCACKRTKRVSKIGKQTEKFIESQTRPYFASIWKVDRQEPVDINSPMEKGNNLQLSNQWPGAEQKWHMWAQWLGIWPCYPKAHYSSHHSWRICYCTLEQGPYLEIPLQNIYHLFIHQYPANYLIGK